MKEKEVDYSFEREKIITKRMIIKLGSDVITDGKNNVDLELIKGISKQAAILYQNGVEIIIVTSGAVACGEKATGKSNSNLDRQVAALFGQPSLISEWVKAFKNEGIENVGQLLLEDKDLENIKPVLDKALKIGPVVVNANDPTGDYEIKKLTLCADNDRLAGSIGEAIGADMLPLLTDVDGVLDRDKRLIEKFNPGEEIVIFQSPKSIFVGGMPSKINVASNFEKNAIIANGREENVVLKAACGEKVGTRFF